MTLITEIQWAREKVVVVLTATFRNAHRICARRPHNEKIMIADYTMEILSIRRKSEKEEKRAERRREQEVVEVFWLFTLGQIKP